MRLKTFTLPYLIALLTTGCQACDGKVNNSKPPTRPYKETYKYDKTDLIGHIDILKHNGEDYTILVEQIVCDSVINNRQEEQTEGEFIPYVIKLYPGDYQIKLHDKLHHHTYTRYIKIGLKHNIE
jgi:hypothetical protein